MTTAQKLVSVYISQGDEWRRRPLHAQLLRLLEDEGLSGGTVLRAIAGFSRSGGAYTASLVDVRGKQPLVVQFVDTEEQVKRVLPRIREMAPNRLITVQAVEVVD